MIRSVASSSACSSRLTSCKRIRCSGSSKLKIIFKSVSETNCHDSETNCRDSETYCRDSETYFHDSETNCRDSETYFHDSESNCHDSETHSTFTVIVAARAIGKSFLVITAETCNNGQNRKGQ